MTALLTIAAIWVGAVAAVATPCVYAAGNRWWTNYWGRTLMAKDVVIALAYGRSLISVLESRITTPVTWTTVTLTATMAVALVANLAVMIRVTYHQRPESAVDEQPAKDPVA